MFVAPGENGERKIPQSGNRPAGALAALTLPDPGDQLAKQVVLFPAQLVGFIDQVIDKIETPGHQGQVKDKHQQGQEDKRQLLHGVSI